MRGTNVGSSGNESKVQTNDISGFPANSSLDAHSRCSINHGPTVTTTVKISFESVESLRSILLSRFFPHRLRKKDWTERENKMAIS